MPLVCRVKLKHWMITGLVSLTEASIGGILLIDANEQFSQGVDTKGHEGWFLPSNGRRGKEGSPISSIWPWFDQLQNGKEANFEAHIQ